MSTAMSFTTNVLKDVYKRQKVDNGQYALDYMYDTVSADLLQTELDCCWVKVAGEEPVEYIAKYANRCPVVHLKDFYKEGNPENLYELIGIDPGEKKKEEGRFEFRPVGFGMQVMPEILDAAVANGAEDVYKRQPFKRVFFIILTRTKKCDLNRF